MDRVKTILLLFIIGILILPWQLLCLAHPFGHEHHHHDGPSPCELRAQYQGDAPCFWPPMECKHLSADVGEYQQPMDVKISHPVKAFAIVAILFNWVEQGQPVNEIPVFNHENNNADPPLTTISLRGPPIS